MPQLFVKTYFLIDYYSYKLKQIYCQMHYWFYFLIVPVQYLNWFLPVLAYNSEGIITQYFNKYITYLFPILLRMIIQINMRNFRKQLKLISNLVETVLQYRLDPFEGLSEHLSIIRKKIKHMSHTQQFEQGISEMLVSKQNYQIKNKLVKFQNEKLNKNCKNICLQIRITAIEKCSCQIYNQQLWEFQISSQPSHISNAQIKNSRSIVQFIEAVLQYLTYYSLLPLTKHNKNKYMIDHKVIIFSGQSEIGNRKFENMSNREILLGGQQEGKTALLLKLNYYFNQRKIQQSLKELVNSKYLVRTQNQKKNSFDTADSSRRVSLYQFYDSQLDITVLSGSDFSEQNGEGIELELQNFEEDEQFQMLIEETENKDQLFLKDNHHLMKLLNFISDDYL